MTKVTCDRGEANRFADNMIAQYEAQKIPGNPRVCIDLKDYPSDAVMDAAIVILKGRGYYADPVEFKATSGRAGCLWVSK